MILQYIRLFEREIPYLSQWNIRRCIAESPGHEIYVYIHVGPRRSCHSVRQLLVFRVRVDTDLLYSRLHEGRVVHLVILSYVYMYRPNRHHWHWLRLVTRHTILVSTLLMKVIYMSLARVHRLLRRLEIYAG